MTTFDRYLGRLFVKVLLICTISIAGLYIVIDACGNLDEFLGYGERQGSLLAVLGEYYAARVPWLFDSLSPLLCLIAGMFAVTWLQRTNELAALMAAGISKGRILRPLILGTLLVSVLAAANRELVIPALRPKLLRNAQDWLGEAPRPLEPLRDNRTDILIGGLHTYAESKRIERPSFRMHRAVGDGGFGKQITADNAFYHPPREGRPGGYLMVGVRQPENVDALASVYAADGSPVLLAPPDTPWLEAGQCFVVSEIGFAELAGGNQWRQFASTPELLEGLRNPSLDYGLDARVAVHSRMVRPLLDMTLFFLGIPLVLLRDNRRIFLAAGWGLAVVVVFFGVTLFCQALGNNGYLLRPALAAWMPLLIFAPVAAYAASPIWE